MGLPADVGYTHNSVKVLAYGKEEPSVGGFGHLSKKLMEAVNMEYGKYYTVTLADGSQFKSIFFGTSTVTSDNVLVAKFKNRMEVIENIVSALETSSKFRKPKAMKAEKVCTRCGGSGKYLNYGECYGCGGRGKI